MREVENKIIQIFNDLYLRATILLLVPYLFGFVINIHYGILTAAKADFIKMCILVPANYFIYKTKNIDFKKIGNEAFFFYTILIASSLILYFPIAPFIISYIASIPIFFLIIFDFKKSVFISLIFISIITLGAYIDYKYDFFYDLYDLGTQN